MTAGVAADFETGVALAADTLASGDAYAVLTALVEITNDR
jgi:anthranilate phosphoribosyltransferase